MILWLGSAPDYGYVLAVYWRYAPFNALQQRLVVVIVWAHGTIGLYSNLVLRRSWPRLAPIVVPLFFAIPILALLGFAHAGEAVLARLASDTDWRALMSRTFWSGKRRVFAWMSSRLGSFWYMAWPWLWRWACWSSTF